MTNSKVRSRENVKTENLINAWKIYHPRLLTSSFSIYVTRVTTAKSGSFFRRWIFSKALLRRANNFVKCSTSNRAWNYFTVYLFVYFLRERTILSCNETRFLIVFVLVKKSTYFLVKSHASLFWLMCWLLRALRGYWR